MAEDQAVAKGNTLKYLIIKTRKTCGRGHKGHKSRRGSSIHPRF